MPPIQTILTKLINKETILYLIFGVLTTLTDWLTYAWMRNTGISYQLSTIGAWAAAVAFAYVTNKLFVFESKNLTPKHIRKEALSFIACRLATGIFTLIAMIALVDGLGITEDMLFKIIIESASGGKAELVITQDMICKIMVSIISLVLNYILSKRFIFKESSKAS